MAELELTSGWVDYEDTGGGGPVVVMFGGLAIGGSLWRKVTAELRNDHRCIVPTLPVGAHRRPVRTDFALSPHSVALLVPEFLARLDLDEVTLVENDSGRAQTVVAEDPSRIGRLVLTSCEAFDNYPPGLPGRAAALAAAIPGGLFLLVQALRLRALRRLPTAFGWMSKRRIPDEVLDGWLRPLTTDPAIRRDLIRYIAAVDPGELLAAAEAMPNFDRPVLVAWAAEDRIMPIEHGRRLAALFPRGRFVAVKDCYTLIPEDQPVRLAGLIRDFVAGDVHA